MALYAVTAQTTILKVDVVVSLGDFEPRGDSFNDPSISLVKDKIKFYEGGVYRKALNFSQFATIGGVAPTSILDAYDKINALIATLTA